MRLDMLRVRLGVLMEVRMLEGGCSGNGIHRLAFVATSSSPWRNWLARLTVNQEVGSSSLPGDVSFWFVACLSCYILLLTFCFIYYPRGEVIQICSRSADQFYVRVNTELELNPVFTTERQLQHIQVLSTAIRYMLLVFSS